MLLTIPESVGYEQNPLSLYYCYDVEDSSKNLNKCIAEVCLVLTTLLPQFIWNFNSFFILDFPFVFYYLISDYLSLGLNSQVVTEFYSNPTLVFEF